MNFADLLICLNLDVTLLTDEDVACLAKRWGYPPALPELMSRHQRLVRYHVGRLAAWSRLGPEDTEDAVQNALVRFPEVLRDYDHDRANWVVGSFQSFLTRALMFSFYKFIRPLRNRSRREDHSLRAQRLLEGQTVRFAGHAVALESREPDPAEVAERTEFQENLQQLLEREGDTARRLWEGKANGETFCDLAEKLGRSPDQTRRLWHRLADKVLVHLHAHAS